MTLLSLFVVLLGALLWSCESRKISYNFPIELLLPVTGQSFHGNATNDKLLCFGNRDYATPTTQSAFSCLIGILFPSSFGSIFQRWRQCHNIFSSRHVIVESLGSMEIIKLSKLPSESSYKKEMISINATRWLDLSSLNESNYQKKDVLIPAEPTYLCARSTNWQKHEHITEVPFNVTFQPGVIRESDQLYCSLILYFFLFILFLLASSWLLPYVISLICYYLSYQKALNISFSIFITSCLITCLTPLMLTKKNRHLAKLYISYFFTRVQAEETKQVIRQRYPVFQAIYFSSVLICSGMISIHFLYSYVGIMARETRNTLVQTIISVAISWFVFFLGRSIERFLRDWIWIVIAIYIGQLYTQHINPSSRQVIFVSLMMLLYAMKVVNGRIVKYVMRQLLYHNYYKISKWLVYLPDNLAVRIIRAKDKFNIPHHGTEWGHEGSGSGAATIKRSASASSNSSGSMKPLSMQDGLRSRTATPLTPVEYTAPTTVNSVKSSSEDLHQQLLHSGGSRTPLTRKVFSSPPLWHSISTPNRTTTSGGAALSKSNLDHLTASASSAKGISSSSKKPRGNSRYSSSSNVKRKQKNEDKSISDSEESVAEDPVDSYIRDWTMDGLKLAVEEAGGDGVNEDEVYNRQETEVMNRNTLSQVLNADLSPLAIHTAIAGPGKREDGSGYSHIIGAIPLAIHAHGPLLIDNSLLYLPLAALPGSVCLQQYQEGCGLITSVTTFLSEPHSPYYKFSVEYKLPSNEDAVLLRQWLTHASSNKIILHLLEKAMDSRGTALFDDDDEEEEEVEIVDDSTVSNETKVRMKVVVRGHHVLILLGVMVTVPTSICKLQQCTRRVIRTLQGAVVEQFTSAIIENISLGGSTQSNNSQVTDNGGIYTIYAEAVLDAQKTQCNIGELLNAHAALKQRSHRREENEVYGSLASFTTSLLHAIGHDDTHATDVCRCNLDLVITEEKITVTVVSPIIITNQVHPGAEVAAAATCYNMLLGRSNPNDLEVPSRHLAAAFCALYVGILMDYVHNTSAAPSPTHYAREEEEEHVSNAEINVLELSAVDNVEEEEEEEDGVDVDLFNEVEATPVERDPLAQIHQMYNPLLNDEEYDDDDLDIEMFSDDDESEVSAEGSKFISLNDFESDSGRSSSRGSNGTNLDSDEGGDEGEDEGEDEDI